MTEPRPSFSPSVPGDAGAVHAKCSPSPGPSPKKPLSYQRPTPFAALFPAKALLCSELGCGKPQKKKPSRRVGIPPPCASLQDLAPDAFGAVQGCAVPRMLPEQIPAVRARESSVIWGTDRRTDGWVDGCSCAPPAFSPPSEESALSLLPNRAHVLWQGRAKMTFRALELFKSRARIALQPHWNGIDRVLRERSFKKRPN